MRILSDTPEGVFLQYVFKPHRGAITNICVSDDGSLLVTGSDDGTVFIFSLELKAQSTDQAVPFTRQSVSVKPLGFITLEGIACSIALSPDDNVTKSPFTFQSDKGNKSVGHRIFVNLKDGSLLAGLIPIDVSLDSSTTFEISPIKFNLKRWDFEIKDRPQVIESVLSITKDDASRPNSGNSRSSDLESKNIESHLKNVKEVVLSLNSLRKIEGLQLEQGSRVTCVYFLRSGYFLAAIINKKEECEIRICNILAATFSKLVSIGLIPINKLQLNRSNRFIMAGAIDGTTSMIKFNLIDFVGTRPENDHEVYSEYIERSRERFESLQKAKDQLGDKPSMASTGQHWHGHAHDIVNGKITNIQTSFDDAFIISSGCDGGLFVWRVLTELKKENPILTDNLSEQSDQFNCPEDIIDPKMYSIQESKMKSEQDKEIEQADSKKQVVRNFIQELRNEYLSIIAENEKWDVEKRFPRSMLSVDPYLERDIELETKEKLNYLEKELAWISEKEAVGPRKLQRKFLDPLQYERIELKALKTDRIVSTFRTMKLERGIKDFLAPLYSLNTEDSMTQHANDTLEFKGFQINRPSQNHISGILPNEFPLKTSSGHNNVFYFLW